MGEVALDGVGAPGPGVDIEGAVLLAGVGVVVLEGGVVALVQAEIELGHEGVGRIGAGDGPEVTGQRAAEGGIHKGQQVGVDQCLPVGLLGLVIDLLVIGEEEEDLVAHNGPAEGGAELVLGEVGRKAGGGATGKLVLEVC